MKAINASSGGEATEDIPLEYFVFSCGICQATLPEIYATTDSNQGFHSGSGDDEGIVTKMWIADCSHIFCGKHLSGGAVLFHPAGEQPITVCPQCSERGDQSAKSLYGIRGLQPGQLDAQIPVEWIQCPAVQFDGTIPGMEAVRFQYMSIARYAQGVTRHLKRAVRRQHAMHNEYLKEHKLRMHIQHDLDAAKAKLLDFNSMQAKLQKWETRKPVINHYLSIVHDMSNDIRVLRDQLEHLGYEVPQTNYAFDPGNDDRHSHRVRIDVHAAAHIYDNNLGSCPTKAVVPDEYSSSSLKRAKHAHHPNERQVEHFVLHREPRTSSRNMMPPPLPRNNLVSTQNDSGILSVQDQKRMKNIITYEPHISRGRESPKVDTRLHEHGDAMERVHETHSRLPFRTPQRGALPGAANEQGHGRPTEEPVAQDYVWSGSRELWPSTDEDGNETQPPFHCYSDNCLLEPQVKHQVANYSTLAQLSPHQQPAASISRPASRIATQLHTIQDGRSGIISATRSLQSHGQEPAASVLSPFFKRDAMLGGPRKVLKPGRQAPQSYAAQKGASVIINYTSDSSSEKAEKLANQLSTHHGVKCLSVQADLGTENGPAVRTLSFHLVNMVSNHFAHPKTRKLQIDIVINNAGVASKSALQDCTVDEFARLYNVNVRGPLLIMKAVEPHLPHDRSGRIVNVSSVSSSLGFEDDAMYGGTKAALEAMTRTWARELAERCTVNAVNPGPVATDMYAGTTEEFQRKMSNWTKSTPLAGIRPSVDRKDLVDGADVAGGRPVSSDHPLVFVVDY
ncbi:hypothetical protein LTR62_007294 [Meristemomyces frigidus]|uniref:Uncharacterized protein n=1 Tax=Meristemomyces frigidus TaxID=1508187 RepID=A0AAN7TM98_9PEZI|nr:hypothetical protein LTR62_007294 [Meristemomyces frigidus]